jgi:hypothetical protein
MFLSYHPMFFLSMDRKNVLAPTSCKGLSFKPAPMSPRPEPKDTRTAG